MDNNNMNTIKFINEKQVLINNKTILNKIFYVKEYDVFYKINGEYYA